MAFSSSSSSSSSAPIQKFDVFLSFRGEDTRDRFTSHLHAALRRSKIVTYIDYELAKGGEISPALLKAIGESNISVIVLSENYASSTWCLDELVHILSCRERNGQIVLPVFYGVAPSVVRKQQGSYAAALDVLEQRFAPNTEKVRKWRVALETVAKLSGWDTSVIRPESKLIEEIVKDILERLSRTTRVKDEYKRLVGMQKRVEKIESVLHISSSDIRVICIWGMAGIGKTTLARFVFDKLSSQFDGCCFVEEIAKYLNTLGEKGLKKEVISKLLDDNTISNLSEFAELSFYEDRLQRSKVLIVLDNLKDWNHLRLIVGDDNRFGPGSLIIVTTKDKQVVKNRIDDNRIYEVEGLDHDEALHLFNFNAFSKNLPTANFIEMAKEVVNHCEGNPLALNVLGSYFGSKSEERWKDALEKLKRLPNNEVQKKLKMSYDELDEMQKDIFLDIACFFEGEDKDHVEKILDACGFFAGIGIDDLIDKSLLTVANNKLKMHSLLQEMGQEVVRQQSIKFPEKRSRIWLGKDVHHVLQDNMGTQTIEGIFFNMSEINSEIFLNCTTLQKMKNLRLLKFYNLDPNMKCKVYLTEDFCLPDSLRYLHWDGYSLEAFPADFTAKYLTELNMPNSQVKELWSGVEDLTSLRKIDFSNSKNLREISSLCRARNVEHVYLEHCGSLSQVPSDFKHLAKLQTLRLEGCSSLKVFPELSSNIECLVLSGTSIEQVPSSIRNLTQLHILCMRDCKRLVSLPTSICDLKLLYSLSLSGCTKLEKFPEIPEPMWSLMSLELEKTSIEALSNITTKNLAGVEHFTFEGHKLIPYNNCSRWVQVHNVCDCELLPYRHVNISYMFESSKCLSLVQLKYSLVNQRLELPFQFFYEKYCQKMEISSISRSALLSGLSDDIQKLRNKRFYFYNSFEFNGCLTIIDDIISSEYKFRDTEIRRRSKVKRLGFGGADIGICYNLNYRIPEWFRYQFENCSSGRITLNIGEILTGLSGFVVCVVVQFGGHYFEFNKLRVVCQVHYELSDGRLLSWDFYSDYETQLILRKIIKLRSRDFMSAESRQMFDNCVDNLAIKGAVFDFYFLDENNKPIQGCSLRSCGINLLFEEELKKLGFVGGKDSTNDEFKPSGSELLDSHAANYSGWEGVNIVVSISEHTLLYNRSEILFCGFLRLEGRNGMESPRVIVSRYEAKFNLPNFEGVLVLDDRYDSGAYRPGSNIPNFFEHKFDNSQMWIDLPPDCLDNNNFVGFVLCAVVNFKDFNCLNHGFKLQYQCDTSIAQYSSSSMHSDMRLKRELVDRHDYDSFRLRLEDKAHREIRRGLNGGEYISYVWSFKLRCLDGNFNPLDQDKCFIKKCAVKHLFSHELGTELDSPPLRTLSRVRGYYSSYNQNLY